MTITAEVLLSIEDRTTIGMMLLKDIVGAREHVRDIAHGIFDKELRLGLFYALHNRYAENAEECNVPGIDTQLDVFKGKAAQSAVDDERESRLIAALNAFDRLYERTNPSRAQSLQDKQKRAMDAQRNAFLANSAPAPEGTVKEIAAKYNLSLSEVRRRKAAGIPFGEPA